ncbi:Legionaminic acid biosynthesis protein PtmF [Anaerovibrio sp. JC8]|uniref:Gfo/Idh/MocA family protein n=1 Tax=Anaerovibrio sp. JC8 TaxID=1240085 RepID=UPI000A0A9513|nr:Gfo/Idh/MocA family oxidoreductase [Anaerovibrio sp. JC8]ORU01007.1 Legionaminic acid biosynthesis protein PtmF [Anaerovibrio sp. JC8]
MNILVVGLGSMGKRRIRLIKELYPEFAIYGVDGREDRQAEAREMYGIATYSTISAAKIAVEIDTALVCTSPLSHNAIIAECLNNKWHVFTELNLVSDGYVENMKLAEKNGCTLFLSSTFLYREEIRYLREKISPSGKWNYVYHIGQYLPDWHPWENYKDFFIGDKRTNGCREIMAIELPWLSKTFGKVIDYSVVSDCQTELNIDYNDNYIITMKHENGNKGCLIVDVVSPVAVRRLEAYREKEYYKWSGTPDSLLEYCNDKDALVQVHLHEKEEHKEGYRAFVVENAYKNELKEFFSVVNGDKNAEYGFAQDYEILKLIDSLEEQK